MCLIFDPTGAWKALSQYWQRLRFLFDISLALRIHVGTVRQTTYPHSFSRVAAWGPRCVPEASQHDHTYTTRFRVPKTMWAAYDRVAARLGTDRSGRLLEHIRADIREHGDERDLADLEAAERELAERRSRKGGRARRRPDA